MDLVSQLETGRDELGDREYVTLVDCFGRWFDRERERTFSADRWQRRRHLRVVR